MENKSPAFQFYPGDYLKSMRVAEMSLEEEGAYLRALAYCWNNGRLPNDAKRLAFIIGKGCTEEIAAAIIDMFEVDPDDASKLLHERLEKERKKQKNYSREQSQKGKKGAMKRWNPDSRGHTPAIAQAIPNDSFSSSSSISSSFNNTPLPPEGDGESEKKEKTKQSNREKIDSLFESFWKLYPRRVGKGAAAKAWVKMSTEEKQKSIDVMPAHIKLFKNREIQHIPHPSTWLNARRWEDEVAPSDNKIYVPMKPPVQALPEEPQGKPVTRETIERLRAERAKIIVPEISP